MTDLAAPDDWVGPSDDPNDAQFGDAVDAVRVDDPTDADEIATALDGYDAVLLGEPYDGAVIGRKGAREGPAALRDELAGVKTHHFDAGPVGSVADLGDVVVPDDVDVNGAQYTVRGVTRAVHAADALPVFLGGDNSLSYPNALPLVEDGSVGAVNFDAHLDCRSDEDGASSGTPYRQLFRAGLDGYACVGARHFETSTAYADYVREQGGEVVTAEEVGDDVVQAVDRALDALRGVETLYVSVDLDVLDATAAPGVSAPTPGGLTTRELFRALRLVAADDRVAGFEVVECAPPLDIESRTAAAGSRAVAHFLAAAGVDA
ncbi:formimidoylglutamase [Halostella sp. JP-L12]|uniref:formimidoylglutamase n=1 Tax=Halostella TaxID=1843185 RepID=UPI000EF7F145|nr:MULTISPECIES: formimidoylglutamase [Halostella]NHN46680.1 formimidoylglutamase [Halostella sp. JP-L12]